MLLVLALAGCGDEGGGSTGSVTLNARQPVKLDGFEYGFKPGKITVQAGGKPLPLRFELRNTGSLPHDVHVRRGDEELGGSKAIGDGETTSTSITLGPGTYEYYCSIGDHADLGMTGDLKVE